MPASGSTANEAPSKTIWSCPPTWFTYTSGKSWRALASANTSWRSSRLPISDGLALIITTKSGAASRMRRNGLTSYSEPESFQPSSHTMKPTRASPTRNTGATSGPGSKWRRSLKML